MLRNLIICIAVTLSASSFATCPEYLNNTMRKLHSKDLVNLCDTQDGQSMLIVNTASHCGFTPQFKGLEALHQKYRGRGLVVVGFASNDFRQEAKNEASAVSLRIGISTNISSIVRVR